MKPATGIRKRKIPAHINHECVGAIILAAGNSRRMNAPKPFLKFDQDLMFIEKIISTYLGWDCREIVIVISKNAGNQHDYFDHLPQKVTCVVNEHPEFERFYSVKLGLTFLLKSAFCFIQNVDNPFITPQLLDILFANRSQEHYIAPVFNHRGGHPVLLNRRTMDLTCHWPDDSANLKEVLNTMKCRKIEMPDDRILININCQEEYKRYFNDPFPSQEKSLKVNTIHDRLNLP